METTFENPVELIGAYLALYGVRMLAGFVILAVGWWLAKKVAGAVRKVMKKRHVDPAIENFVGSLVHYGLLVFVVIAALSQVGIQTASFIAVIAAAGLAIGLALQGSLANFAAGFLILLLRPFKLGDYIEAAGTAGTVEKIQIFNTELKTPDNKKVIIPNSQITGSNIINYSANPTRRVDLVIGISYGDDIDKAKAVLTQVVSEDERVLAEPATNIKVSNLGDSSVDLIVRPWVNSEDYWGVYWDLTENIKKRLDQEGITIPFPQRDVNFFQEKSS